MKAITFRKFGQPGDVLGLEEIDRPTPKDDEVLLRVVAASTNPADWHMVTGTPSLVRAFFLFKPKLKIAGMDVAGIVEEVGKDVTQFQPGDEVFGEAKGAYAEYACAAADLIVEKPINVTFEAAATIDIAALTALQGLRDRGKLERGHDALIIGSSGGVGSFGVQIARAFGARVTAVCSTRNVETARSIGADLVVDYTKENFIERPERYDLVFDAVGHPTPLACRRALKPGGLFVTASAANKNTFGFLGHMIKMAVTTRTRMVMMRTKQADLEVMAELLAAGKVKPVIDRRYPLAEVADALSYQGEGHAQGKTVIVVDPELAGVERNGDRVRQSGNG